MSEKAIAIVPVETVKFWNGLGVTTRVKVVWQQNRNLV